MGLGRVELPTSRLSGGVSETGAAAERSESHPLPVPRPTLRDNRTTPFSPSARTHRVPTKALACVSGWLVSAFRRVLGVHRIDGHRYAGIAAANLLARNWEGWP